MTTTKKPIKGGLTCTKCGETKFKKEFGPGSNKNGKSSWCKACKKALQKKYAAARRSEPKDPKWIEKHNSQSRASRVAWYGLTEDDYEQMLELQGGVCAGCGRPPNPDRKLDIDHSHQPGDKKREPFERASHVRGLLCHLCNRVLGILRDNPNTFQNLAEYLRHPPAHKVVLPKLEKLAANTELYFKRYEERKDAALKEIADSCPATPQP